MDPKSNIRSYMATLPVGRSTTAFPGQALDTVGDIRTELRLSDPGGFMGSHRGLALAIAILQRTETRSTNGSDCDFDVLGQNTAHPPSGRHLISTYVMGRRSVWP
jgi:hypothetical protein